MKSILNAEVACEEVIEFFVSKKHLLKYNSTQWKHLEDSEQIKIENGVRYGKYHVFTYIC
jgi:hypothetical protein